MSTQNANAVAITGGSINGTNIGATTPSSVKATTLQATGETTLAASTSSLVPLHMPYGTEPSSPVAGDLWTSYTGIYFKNQDNDIEQLDPSGSTLGTILILLFLHLPYGAFKAETILLLITACVISSLRVHFLFSESKA
jgi:hypothetical protein